MIIGSMKTRIMITFRVQKDGNKIHAYCPELKGCHTFGDSPKEALSNLKEAVSLYLDDELESQTINDLTGDSSVQT